MSTLSKAYANKDISALKQWYLTNGSNAFLKLTLRGELDNYTIQRLLDEIKPFVNINQPEDSKPGITERIRKEPQNVQDRFDEARSYFKQIREFTRLAEPWLVFRRIWVDIAECRGRDLRGFRRLAETVEHSSIRSRHDIAESHIHSAALEIVAGDQEVADQEEIHDTISVIVSGTVAENPEPSVEFPDIG